MSKWHNTISRRLGSALAIAGVACALILIPGNAGAAETRTAATPAAQARSEDPGSAGRYCDIVVEKVAPESAASRVTSKVCGDAPAIGARKDVLLMEWFEHANNNPPSLTRIHGGADCDASGDRIPISGFWDNRVSGFITYSLCDFIIAYDGLYEGDAQQYTDRRQPFVGSKMNDRISSFRICRSVPCVG